MRDQGSHEVVPFPTLRGHSIEDTLSGFAEGIGENELLGRREEHPVTMLFAELRGWEDVEVLAGPAAAERLLSQAVGRIIESLGPFGSPEIELGGEPTRPVLQATFAGAGHPIRAVRAACAVREAARRMVHPSADDARFSACIGVNTGTVVDAVVSGSGLAFQATGVVRTFGARLQEFAGPGQIFLSEDLVKAAGSGLRVLNLGPVRASEDGETRDAYCLLEPVTP